MIDYQIPASPAMERCVLGTLLMGGPVALTEAQTRLRGEHFVSGSARHLWDAFEAIANSGRSIDLMLVVQWLSDNRRAEAPEEGGWAAEVAELIGQAGAVSALRDYCEELEERRMRRVVLTAGLAMISASQDPAADWRPIAEQQQTAIGDLLRSGSRRQLEPIRKSVFEVIDFVESAMKAKGHVTHGIGTGFTDLDRTTMGIAAGDMVVLGARPSMGKTALGCNIAANIALGDGHYPEFRQPPTPVVFFSLETPSWKVTRRMVFGLAGVDMNRSRDGFLDKDHSLKAFNAAAQRVAQAPMWILDQPGLTIQEMTAVLRSAVIQYGLPKEKLLNPSMPRMVVIIDYIQKMRSLSRQALGNRVLEIGEISKGLKSAFLELGIAGIVLAQLNRDAERGRPSSAQLRESGDIEQDADHIWLLHRPSRVDQDADPTEAELHVVKNKDGGCAEIPLHFDGPTTLFKSVTEKLFSNNQEKRQANRR